MKFSRTKPTLGLMPKRQWDRQRCDDILAAIQRYQEAGKPIPQEWIIELATLDHCTSKEMEHSAHENS